MLGFFKKNDEKVYYQIRGFEQRLNQSLVPLLNKPQKPILANAAMIGMATNIALYFLAARNLPFFQKHSKFFIYEIGMSFGEVVETATGGKVKKAEAAISLTKEMEKNGNFYCTALAKSPSNPQEALEECLKILSNSAEGWTFKGESEHAIAVIKLSEEITKLMTAFRSLI